MAHVAHINFDTYQFVETLKSSGVPEPQAKAMLEVQKKSFEQALDNTLATKLDIQELKAEIQEFKHEVDKRFNKVELEIKFIKWSNSLMIAGIATLILKAFF